jgi:hypothetical protein
MQAPGSVPTVTLNDGHGHPLARLWHPWRAARSRAVPVRRTLFQRVSLMDVDIHGCPISRKSLPRSRYRSVNSAQRDRSAGVRSATAKSPAATEATNAASVEGPMPGAQQISR